MTVLEYYWSKNKEWWRLHEGDCPIRFRDRNLHQWIRFNKEISCMYIFCIFEFQKKVSPFNVNGSGWGVDVSTCRDLVVQLWNLEPPTKQMKIWKKKSFSSHILPNKSKQNSLSGSNKQQDLKKWGMSYLWRCQHSFFGNRWLGNLCSSNQMLVRADFQHKTEIEDFIPKIWHCEACVSASAFSGPERRFLERGPSPCVRDDIPPTTNKLCILSIECCV